MAEAGLPRGTVTVRLTDDETIRQLNRRYLGHDYPTDVITFHYDEVTSKLRQLGDIVISWDTACRQAAEYGLEPETEVGLLAIHGVLHLAGWDDATEDQRAAMHRRAEEILAAAGGAR
jgi:probable rRNA maturation factor